MSLTPPQVDVCFLQDFHLAAPRRRCKKDEIQNLSWDLSHLMVIG